MQQTEKSVLCTSLLSNLLNSFVKKERLGILAKWVIQMNSVFKASYCCAEAIPASVSSGLSSSIFALTRIFWRFLVALGFVGCLHSIFCFCGFCVLSFFFSRQQPRKGSLCCAHLGQEGLKQVPNPRIVVLNYKITPQYPFTPWSIHLLYEASYWQL